MLSGKGTRALQPGMISLLAAAYVLLFVLYVQKFDWSELIKIGQQFTQPELPSSLQASTHSGYDGQFYYRLAIDPLTGQQCAHGLCLDWPRYRQQRILYPLLARLAALGRVDWLPYALPMVNLLGLGAIGALGGWYALSVGRSAWWGLLFATYLGLFISLAMDLTEITEITLLLAGLVALQRRWLSAALLALAVLARETAVIFAGAVLLVALVKRWPGWAWYLLPVATYASWQLWLAWHWGDYRGYGQFFQLPGWAAAQVWLQASQHGRWDHIALIPVLAALGLLVALRLPSSRAPTFIKIAWLAYAAMYWGQGRHVWIDPISYVRVGAEFYSLGLIVLINPINKGFEMIRWVKMQWAGLLVWAMMFVYRMGKGSPEERAQALQLLAEYKAKKGAK